MLQQQTEVALRKDELVLVPTEAIPINERLDDGSDHSTVYSGDLELALDAQEDFEQQQLTEEEARLPPFGLDRDGLPVRADLLFADAKRAADFRWCLEDVSRWQKWRGFEARPVEVPHVVLWDFFGGTSCLDLNCSAGDIVHVVAEEYQVRMVGETFKGKGAFMRLPHRWSLARWLNNKPFQPVVGLIPSAWLVNKKFYDENRRYFKRATWFLGIADVSTAYETILEDRSSYRAGLFVIFSPKWLNLDPADHRPFRAHAEYAQCAGLPAGVVDEARAFCSKFQRPDSVETAPAASVEPVKEEQKKAGCRGKEGVIAGFQDLLPLSQLPADHAELRPHSSVRLDAARVAFREEDVLGAGAFATVFKGRLQREAGGALPIAVKKLRVLPPQNEQRQAWVAEMEVLQLVSHPNVARFFGFCFDAKGENAMLAFEFMDCGALSDFLKNRRFEVSANEQVDFLTQIARGMSHLHALDPPIIHGDLAARNVLMTHHPTEQTRYVLKVSDFGLSKTCRHDAHVYPDDPHKLPSVHPLVRVFTRPFAASSGSRPKCSTAAS
ncbi:hypothetical protein M3Y99_00528300 [Aphelenchoides fujianensis]|nr:hypothetical protein M3Y99_00528300 [Aphelenchoides fujianensis]